MIDVKSFFAGSQVVVTGAAGTVGRELVRQLLALQVERLIGLDNYEHGVHDLSESIVDRRFRSFHSDVRDVKQLREYFQNADYVFHAAALKHVPVCELSPSSPIQTNILGAQNVIEAASSCNVKKVLFTSSDKAVNPTNVMGTSKLMGERLFTAANITNRGVNTIFSSTRFGNVAGSQGSVIPIFCEQIRRGREVTVTDPGMTRFMMTLEEAVSLVINSLAIAQGGEVFVTKMPVVNVGDLASAMIKLLSPAFGFKEGDVKIRIVGSRPGEKFYEELNNSEELRRSFDLGAYIVVLPAITNMYSETRYDYTRDRPRLDKIYHSGNFDPLNSEELEKFLRRPGVLPEDIRTLLDKRSK